MEWKSAQVNEEGFVKIPKRWLHLHYYEALNILFRFENSLRVFVYAILKNEFENKWIECHLSIGDNESKTIKELASKRISQAESFGYLGYTINSPLMHLTSGELVELIASEAYWPIFKGYFKGKKEIIKNKLLEIGSIRNSLAHFRPIKSDDIEVIKQNSKHTLLGIEDCLQNLFQFRLRVPTNTSFEWYNSISTLGTDQITTIPYYSNNEEWINVKLIFKSPIFSKNKRTDGYYVFAMAKLKTASILTEHRQLKEHITYVSEEVGYPLLSEEFDLEITKNINLVFRKDKLEKNHKTIASELQKTLKKITEECDLLMKDSLARGLLIESSRASALFSMEDGKGKWTYVYSGLKQLYESSHPDEYWGETQNSFDIVSGSVRYPWMPADISKADYWDF